jgi:hypothetical protein
MAKYEKVGKGAAFTREKMNDRQPDFGGSLTLNEEEFQVSLWKSRTKKGDPYLSIQVSRKLEDDSDMSGPWDAKSEKPKEYQQRKDAM